MTLTAPLARSASASDADLVSAALAGSADAFGGLVERYRAIVIGLAMGRSRDLDRAEDLAQEVFLAAYRSLASLRDPETFRSWLLAIARHRIVDEVRANRLPVVDAPIERAAAVPPSEPDADLVAALAALPERYRLPVVLRHMDGLEYPEVALRLGITEAAARQRVKRALDRLRERLGRNRT